MKFLRYKKEILKIIFVSLILMLYQNCYQNGGTTTGSPISDVEYRFDSFDLDPPEVGSKPIQVAAVGTFEVRLCVFELRVEKHRPSGYGDGIHIDSRTALKRVGEVELIQDEMSLIGIGDLESGIYNHVEIQLSQKYNWKPCPSSDYIKDTFGMNLSNLAVKNDNGEFASNSVITLKYDGDFILDETEPEFIFNSQDLVDALRTVNAQEDPGNDPNLITIDEVIIDKDLGSIY